MKPAALPDPEFRQWPTMLVLLAGMFLLLHPYLGLVHDSRIYTLQALNLLHPELYGNDVYLRFGSQDDYSFFSPLYAGLIWALGAERAGSLLTLLSNTAVLIGAWWLARTLMPPRMAWLAVGILILIPGYYGPDIFFSVLEGFATPRQLAQALAIFALVAWIHGRLLACAAALVAGLLVHPIMTLSAALLIAVMLALPFWRKFWPLALAGAIAAVAIVAGWLPISHLRFDQEWWPMVGRENLLLLSEWTLPDWSRIFTTLTTLVFGALTLRDFASRLALGTLVTSGLALLLSFVGGDLAKIVIIIQGQAWRALWLATVFGALLLPAVAAACWRGSSLHRAGLLLLFGAWIAGHQSLALAFSVPALSALILARMNLVAPYGRSVLLAATILLAVAVLCVAAFTFEDLGGHDSADATATFLDGLRFAFANGLMPCAILLGIWHLTRKMTSGRAHIALALIVSVPAAGVAAATADSWSKEQYPRGTYEAFATWRSLIPTGSDVLWATEAVSGSDPSTVWLLLQRPSYYSSVQVNSALFSRAAAIELGNRYNSIPVTLPVEQAVRIARTGLPPLSCEDVPAHFVITDAAISGARAVAAPGGAEAPFDRLKLQICP